MLHLDCSYGVSGDMLVGSLIDLGADIEPIRRALSGIAEISVRDVTKAGIPAKKFDVRFAPESGDYITLIHVLEKLNVTEQVKVMSRKILHTLAIAESRVHETTLEKVHLHEARDSIVDAVAFSISLENLNLMNSKISCSPVSVGTTAPATNGIIAGNSLPTRFLLNEEIATPTGMAILAVVVDEFNNNISPRGRTGHGAGDMDFPHPNVLRALIP